jgi:glycyl-tRNA synthetase
MFDVSVGAAKLPAYLRPETAQGQFLNFDALLEENQNSMPFASASIGKAGRNEIAPRAGLLRVREFLMAEIEHYVDPEGGKKHYRFQEVADVQINLLDRHVQLAGKTDTTPITLGEAVNKGIVPNETIGYFIARIQLFLVKVGLDPRKIRFREHMENEMAHYASYCVDAELLTSFSWIEVVGCADRRAFDLTCHTKATGVPLVVREARKEPLVITEYVAETNKQRFGPHFKKDGRAVQSAIDQLTQDVKAKLSLELKEKDKITIDVSGVQDGKVELTSELIKIEQQTRTEHVREYIPNVIEPSFGIGRILYSLCEQVFWSREGAEERAVLSFPPAIAPTKVLIVPLSVDPDFKPIVADLTKVLRQQGLSTKVDASSASIGKRYSRRDEVGIPLGITVDFQSLKDGTVTLRDRDTTKQVRAGQDEIVEAVLRLVNGTETWSQVYERLPKFEGQDLD